MTSCKAWTSQTALSALIDPGLWASLWITSNRRARLLDTVAAGATTSDAPQHKWMGSRIAVVCACKNMTNLVRFLPLNFV